MKQITITLTDLQAFLVQVHEEKPELLEGTLLEDFDDPTDFYNNLGYYASETSNWDIINCNRLTFDKEKQEFKLEYHPHFPNITFLRIERFSDWVSRSYDNNLYPWEQNAWDLGYCSGDDDVDYNSSYLDILVEALRLYLDYIIITKN